MIEMILILSYESNDQSMLRYLLLKISQIASIKSKVLHNNQIEYFVLATLFE